MPALGGGYAGSPLTPRPCQLHIPGRSPHHHRLPVLTCLACSGHRPQVERPGHRQWEAYKTGVLGSSGMEPLGNVERQADWSEGLCVSVETTGPPWKSSLAE